MSTSKGKLKAFSVLEATFSLLVSAIIIGLIYVLFDVLSFRIEKFKNENESTSDLSRFSSVLRHDLFKNDKLHIQEKDLVLNGVILKEVRYHFEESIIIRSHNQFKDTFHFRITMPKIDTIQYKSKTRQLQRLNFNLMLDEQQTSIYFYKNIYPDQLLSTKNPTSNED
jgi:hypothetical protein